MANEETEKGRKYPLIVNKLQKSDRTKSKSTRSGLESGPGLQSESKLEYYNTAIQGVHIKSIPRSTLI